MDLTHRFSVPAPIDEAWSAFNNLEALAPCFPGATVSSIEGDEFTGSVKIKLGPIALVYNGSGRFVERDDADRRVVIEARGKDKRGNGTATARVSASFVEDGEQTEVQVLTDLAITGKPAQFGRGVISDVSDKLLEQFVTCLSGRFAEGTAAAPEAAMKSDVAAAGAGFDQADTEQTIEIDAVSALDDAAVSAPVADSASPPAEPASPAAQRAPTAPRAPMAPRAPAAPAQAAGSAEESTVDVLRTIGPVLLKRYGPVLAVFGLVLFIVIKIVRRRS